MFINLSVSNAPDLLVQRDRERAREGERFGKQAVVDSHIRDLTY